MATTHGYEAAAASYRRDLGEGLVLRWSTAADTAKIAQLVGLVFREGEGEPSNEVVSGEVYELMSGRSPLMNAGDYVVVEDTSREGQPIVACTCLWHHRWAYEGISFGVGQPEIVATDPRYRNKGLVRALFEVVQARSEFRGDMAQVITGIPYFYRLFGYEYVLDLGGKRVVYTSHIPKAGADQAEAYVLREASVEDVPEIQRIYDLRRSGVVTADVPDAYWSYLCEVHKSTDKKHGYPRLLMIVDAQQKVYGYARVATIRSQSGSNYNVYTLDTLPGINLRAMMLALLRELQRYGAQLPVRGLPEPLPLTQISLGLGRTHPAYTALGNLAPLYEAPYAWYVRIPDVPAFLKHIAPALEKRLAHSVIAGYTGELKVDMYRGGLRMLFEQGKLIAAEPWRAPAYGSDAGAGCPQLVFLQLLLCHRSLDELRQMFPEVWAEGETEIILKALFPPQISAPFSINVV